MVDMGYKHDKLAKPCVLTRKKLDYSLQNYKYMSFQHHWVYVGALCFQSSLTRYGFLPCFGLGGLSSFPKKALEK
jgi:hypothetical protein